MSWGYIGAAAITAVGSYASSKKNSKKATSSTQEPAWLSDASEDAVTRARELSRRQYTPFTDQRVAGLTANEQQASRMAAAFGREAQTPFSADKLEAFQNPYLDQVFKNRQRAIGEEYGRQSADLAKNQAAMNAFRSGRSDLARSRLNESRLRALSEGEATDRANAFNTAMNAYQQDQANRRSNFESAESNLAKTGAIERSINQAQNDFDYGQFLERRDWDVNNLTPLLNSINAARGGSTTTTTGSSGNKDYWGAAAGLLGTAIQQYFGNNGSTTVQSPDYSEVYDNLDDLTRDNISNFQT